MRAPAFLCSLLTLVACDEPGEVVRRRADRLPVPGSAEVVGAHDGSVASDDTGDGALPDAVVASEVSPADAAPADSAAPPETLAPETSEVPDTTPVDDTPADEVTPAPTGGLADPIVVERFPFVTGDSTATSTSDALQRYDCASGTDESGPERVYRFDVDAAGELVAEVAEADGVDVDLHLLAADPAEAPPSAVPCRARANTRLVLDLAPGRYWLVVDTYVAAGGAAPGDYRLALEHTVLDVWQTTPVAPGIVWRKKVYSQLAGGRQTINTLDVDASVPSVSIRPHGGDGCIRPSRAAEAEGAVAAINAGFFDTTPGTCPPLDLLKIEGELVSTNHLTGAAQRSVGVDPGGRPIIAWVEARSDWPEAWSAVGSYPSLVTDGHIAVEPDKDTDFFDGRHPRSALGITPSGHLLFVTVDGRTAAGRGMTLGQLAQHLLDLGATQGVNLDGGGSTAMWIEGQSLNGIVSYPSDNGAADHLGERAVSDVLLVFSSP
jgi:hypothetical protein